MNRSSGQFQAYARACQAPLLAAGFVLLLSACNDGPGNPKPPLAPPRPVTELGAILHADMKLPARPETRRAVWM